MGMQLQDMWSNTFAGVGTRTMAPGGEDEGITNFILCGLSQCYDLVLPDKYKENSKTIDVPTSIIWMIGRTQVLGYDFEDISAIQAFQKQYKLTKLSVWLSGGLPLPVIARETLTFPDNPSPNDITENMTGCEFFDMAAELGALNPANISTEMEGYLELLGIQPGGTLPEPCAPYLQVPTRVWSAEILYLSIQNTVQTGSGSWHGLRTIGEYGFDYASRADVADVGLGGNLPADAVYYLAPSPGYQLTGDHTITFQANPTSPDPAPPVKAFWSITVYGVDKFLIPSPPDFGNPELGVCNINNMNTNITAEDDGSIIIYLQYDKPSDPDANWLCAPKTDPFIMTFRAYWPDESIIDFTYDMGIVSPNE